jgi:hypothetical protein
LTLPFRHVGLFPSKSPGHRLDIGPLASLRKNYLAISLDFGNLACLRQNPLDIAWISAPCQDFG